MKKNLLLFFVFCSFVLSAQKVIIRGNVTDSVGGKGLPNALLMAIRFTDSTLVNYTRTDKNGIFKPIVLPCDTYVVLISHPAYADKIYFFEATPKDSVIPLKNVVLPSKSVELNEIEILAFKEKMFYKGDTLMFTADSFQTRPNATVEDLLKKLPGFQVDTKGKITVQGKEVDQVLVDGDEFFGSDPTVATRNLNATSIENVQVYEKKNENTADDSKETLKVINLQMKEDAKKGYFGKVSGASDFQNFYEGELLINKFKGSQKISVFALGANTPKQAFSQNDAWKFGLENERGWQYDEESNSWNNSNQPQTGIPQTVKSGFYFNDRFGKNNKVNSDYTFNRNHLVQGSETNTQNFLADTTFSTRRVKNSELFSYGHNFNLNTKIKLDSLTELMIVPKGRYTSNTNKSSQSDEFISDEGIKTRQTNVQNHTIGENMDASMQIRFSRNFKKKDRAFAFQYTPSIIRSTSTTSLNSEYISLAGLDSALIQKRDIANTKDDHTVFTSWMEPLSKKFKVSLNYQLSQSIGTTNKTTLNNSGLAYDIINLAQSNSFQNTRITNKAETRLIYDVKKFRIAIGTAVRNTHQESFDRTANDKRELGQLILLPLSNFTWRINQGSNMDISYRSNSRLPDIRQMQPVVDNSDPNRLSIGTPSLVPTFGNDINFNYWFYKGISDVNFWSGFNIGNNLRDFSSYVTYDSLGRSISQMVNVDGNYRGYLWFGGGFPLFKKFMKVYVSVNAGTWSQNSFINGNKNQTTTSNVGPNLRFEKSTDNFNIEVYGEYQYNVPKSSISDQASQSYYNYELGGEVAAKLPKKFFLTSDVVYTNNGNRWPGYNLNFTIWNAGIGRSFLKTENLSVSVNAFDLLNQNINNTRNVFGNQITDEKTQIIKRYFLLKVLYKFNNQKTKVEDDDDF
jgi:hypothetical protein